MIVRWLVVAGVGRCCWPGGDARRLREMEANSASDEKKVPALVEASASLIDEVVRKGCGISIEGRSEAQISSGEGAPLDLKKIESDVRVLDGWDGSGEIGVETQSTK